MGEAQGWELADRVIWLLVGNVRVWFEAPRNEDSCEKEVMPEDHLLMVD
jgi:hypothetical protein